MKQPEIFKNWRKSWETPLTRMSGSDEDYLNNLRETALYSIRVYKKERNKIEQRKKDEQEIFKFFSELDKISEKQLFALYVVVNWRTYLQRLRTDCAPVYNGLYIKMCVPKTMNLASKTITTNQ